MASLRFTRGLRFRLTASYALFFALVLIAVAAVLRQGLASKLDEQARDLLDQEWAAMKGYLRIEKQVAYWYFDPSDPDEAFIAERLRRVYLLTDAEGNQMESSTLYRSLGVDPPDRIRQVVGYSIKHPQDAAWSVRTGPQGQKFLIRSGVIYDEGHHTPYFLAIGSSLQNNENILRAYSWIYAAVIPAIILTGCLLGWFLAGHALTPVMEVARAAQRISGSNLSLRIPTRQAHDELDTLIETFNRMIERLENSFNQVRQFSGDVSHELRTPITAIRGQLEVALFTAKTTEQYHEAMLNALQDIERLSQIVRALLLLSQAESGQLALQKTRFDMTEVVRDVVEQFQIPAEAQRVRLTCDLPQECSVELDRVQFERMLSNLLTNAIKFTPAGGQVTVALRRLPDSIEIGVQDTGRGIPAEHLPHIFDRFYRVPGAEPAGPERGLGLGLSFVAWIVKAHGGRIHVDSRPGDGTRFTVVLPAGTPAAIAAPAGSQPVVSA